MANPSAASTRSESTHELADYNHPQWTEQGYDTHFSLPRADGGKDAWLFLTACFILEALIWGFPFSFGVFQVYYSQHEPFASESANIAAIGTTATGIMYFALPFAAVVVQRWPKIRKPGMMFGALVAILALVAASFCDSVDGLIGTQGAMYAAGGILCYCPTLQYIDEWFIKRKGFAYGVVWAGTGSAGVVVPFLLQWLLDSYGFRTTLRIWAIIMTITVFPALFFVKGRLPLTSSNAFRPSSLSFLRTTPFWIYEIGNILQSLGYFLPSLWLPSFALSIGLPAFCGPLSLALLYLAYCFGAIVLGSLVDRFHAAVPILVSTLGSMVAIFIFWGFTTGQAMLYIFALLFGFFAGGFAATWSGCATSVKAANSGDGCYTDTSLVLMLLAAGRGVGAVIAGPLSERLLDAGGDWPASFAYGSHYGILIVFSGVSAMLGGTACVGKLLKLV